MTPVRAGARTRMTDRGATPRGVAPILLAALAAAAAVSILVAPDAAALPREPARVQVTADEFRLSLSRVSVPRGRVVIELFNLGEDDHDLAVRRLAKGTVTRRTTLVSPGGLGEIDARLLPGRYALWCTLAGHRALGMQATLVVRKG